MVNLTYGILPNLRLTTCVVRYFTERLDRLKKTYHMCLFCLERNPDVYKPRMQICASDTTLRDFANPL